MDVNAAKRGFSRRAAVAAASAFAGVAIARLPARAAQFAWKYGSENTAEHPANAAAIRAFAKIRDETGGAVEISPYLSSSLGSSTAMLSQLRLGALEMLCENGALLEPLVPIASMESIAYAFPDRATIFNAMDGDLGRAVRAEFPAQGFIALDRVWENGYRHLTTSVRPIRTVDDIQGLKLRVATGKLYLDTFRSLGAIPTNFALAELYAGMQTHLVDGCDNTLPSVENLKFYEVQKYLGLSHHMWAGYWMMINRAKWESLPAKFQDAVRRNLNAAALAERRTNEALQQTVREKLQGHGMVVTEVDVASFKSKLSAAGYYARWRGEYGPAAWAALEKYTGPLG